MKKSAVVIPIYEHTDNQQKGILFTRRSEDLPRHAGEISFPGGRKEPEDRNLLDTALRELKEEVGLPRKEVNIIGDLEKTTTTTGYSIQPFIGEITYPYPFELRDEEVEALLFVPIPDLIKSHQKREGRDYFYHEGEEIWGATARIVIKYLNSLESGTYKDLLY